MSDASGSGERPKVKTPILSSQSAMSIGLVITLAGACFFAGKLTGNQFARNEDDAKFITSQFTAMAAENKAATERVTLQITNLKESMEMRAINRDKEIDTINKRLDSHDLTLHELFLAINKMLDRKP